MHDALLFTTLKKLSRVVTQLISLGVRVRGGFFFFLRLYRKIAPACIPLTYAKITMVNNHSKRSNKK